MSRPRIRSATASVIERLEVFWPSTGETQVFTDVPRDRTIEVVEDATGYAELPLASFRLGGAPGR